MNTRYPAIARTVVLLLSTGAAVYLAGCGGGEVTTVAPSAAAADAASTPLFEAARVSDPSSALSADEATSLAFMREEEKLARDVYSAMAALWGAQVFDRIGASEQAHMDAVKQLLSRYGLADPAATTPAGQFVNRSLQSLFDTLIAAGGASLIDALVVGAEIEELDIRDLRTIGTRTDNADLLQVYSNLERGSRNHLRAFAEQLLQRGVTYTPKHITQAEYDAIVGSPQEKQSFTFHPPTGGIQ